MLLDKELEFSDGQALSGAGAAVSTNVIDLGYAGGDAGTGEQMYLVVKANADQGGTTPTLAVALQHSDVEGSGYTDVATIPAQEYSEGETKVLTVPPTAGRYLRLNYTLGGTTPTADVSAFIVQGEQAWKAYADALEAVPN